MPLLKRIPPGLGPGLVWFLAAIVPIVDYVVLPQPHTHSYSYPRDGLDSFAAKALLFLAFAVVLAGFAMLRRRTLVAYGLVVAGTVVLSLTWRWDEIPPLQLIGVDLALGYVASVVPRRGSLGAAAGTFGVLAAYLVLREFFGDDSGTAAE
ncbi:hypothetical protein ACFQ07_18265, partial [Actinomadura adrarensis]